MADEASIHRIPTETAAMVGDPLARKRLEALREWRKPAGEAKAFVPRKDPPAEEPVDSVAAKISPAAPKRRFMRPLLIALLALGLIAGGYFYVTGGQAMSTDNAYVQADTVGVSTDVAGTVVAVEVHDNEPVKKGQVLYRLKQDSFQIALDGAKAQLGTVHDQVLTLQESYKLALAQIEQAQADLPFYQTN